MTTIPHTVVLHKRPDYQSFGIYIGEDIPSGIYIVTIEPNSPAADANIQPGDRVLAVNGQLVSSMFTNPKEILVQTAANSNSLTLTIQSTNILQDINLLSSNNGYNDNYQYTSTQDEDIKNDLERYMQTLFADESLHIVPLSSGNNSEYMLTCYEYPLRLPPHRRRRKRRYHTTNEIPKLINNEQKENNDPLPRYRSIPRMGTSNIFSRNLQSTSRDSALNGHHQEDKSLPSIRSTTINDQDFNTDNIVNYNPDPIPPSPIQQPLNQLSYSTNNHINHNENQPPSMNGDGLHEVQLFRSPDFQGFGFHLQYNQVYYLINEIEPNSPAERGGLRINDIIRTVNYQSVDKMSHENFSQIINSSSDIVFLVQPSEDYYRANPHIPLTPVNNTTVINNTNDGQKRQNMLSKALSKFKNR